jgi:hypothetical protein
MFEHLQTGSHDPNPTNVPPSLDPTIVRALREILLRDPSAHAMWVLKEIERFSTAFPEIEAPQQAIPRFTWEQLERQLMFLAGTPQRQAMVTERVASIRKCAVHKPEEMILQEILIEAWVLLDEEPHGPPEEERVMT